MSFHIPINLPDDALDAEVQPRDKQILVSDESGSVSESHMKLFIKKVAQILATQRLSCSECPKTHYKLYSLSDCEEPV